MINETNYKYLRMYELTEDQKQRLQKDYTYKAPNETQIVRYEVIRAKAEEFASILMRACPKSRELSIALTKLEETVMHANAAIARNEIESDLPVTTKPAIPNTKIIE